MRNLIVGAVLAGCVGGCTNLDSGSRIDEAGQLVGARVGRQPDWRAAWDETAPSWSGDSVLRLDDAVALALRNNRALRAELERIGQADADLVQAGLLANPAIEFMVMFPDGGGRSMLRGNGLPMQALQDLWLIPSRKKIAQAELQQAILRAADRAIIIAADVKKLYARLQYAQRAVELIRDNVQVIGDSTEIIRARQAVGRTTQAAVNLSEIRGLRARSDLRAMQAEYDAARRELLMLMGLPGANAQWRVEPVDEGQPPTPAPMDETRLLSLASEQRLDLLAARWQVEASEENILLMKRESWPDLAVGLGFERAAAPPSNNPKLLGRAGNYATQGLVDRAMGMPSAPMLMPPFNPKMREMEYMTGPMVAVEVPIFDWGQGRIPRAMSEYRQQAAEYESLAQEVIRMVRERLVVLAQSYDQVQLYRDSILPAVERNLEIARRSIIAGQEDLTIYLDVQEDWLMTRLRLLEFYRDCMVNRAELERQVGGRLELSTPASRPASAPAETP